MKKRITFLTALISTLMLSAISVPAQPGKGPGPDPSVDRPHRMWNDLNLTDKQKNKLKTLHEEMQTVRKKHFSSVKNVRNKIKDELLKDAPSQKTLHGYANELGELHKQITRERSDHLLKVKKLLKPDQFKTLLEHERGMGKGKFGHRGDCGSCPHHKKGYCGKGKGHGHGPRDGSGHGCRK